MAPDGTARIRKPPRDAAARERIRNDLNTTFLVEAGAGSGKTRSLVERMLALLREGCCTISTLTAVTFTRKATAEMMERFQIGLERAVRDEEEPGARARLQEALDHFEQCRIGTIHSFCAGLLRERPVEIGLDPGFREMDDIEDALFRRRCWREYLALARDRNGEAGDRLAMVGLVPEDLEEAFNEVCRYPDVEPLPGRTDPPDYERLRYQLTDFLDEIRKSLPENRPRKGWDGLGSLLVNCLARRRNVGLETAPVLMSIFELMDRSPRVTQNRWPDRETALAAQSRFDHFRNEVVCPALRHWREYRHQLIIDWLAPAGAYARRRRRESGWLNFEDLLMRSADLLRRHPEVRESFKHRITHILVDEFQDTDPVQAEVLFLLTGEDSGETDWRRLRPRPGSLFLVGDPKQSIYRFRRADIDTYNLVKSLVRRGGGEVLELTANFRSLPGLSEWGNPVFQSVFPDRGSRHQAAFAKLETVRPPSEENDLEGVFRLSLPRVERHKEKEIASAEASLIAEWLEGAFSGDVTLQRTEEERTRLGTFSGEWRRVRPGDILILFRYRKNMSIYARALEERGVPFEISGSAAFSESEEIRCILNLARALSNPENPVFTVAVLRGLFFGISDHELFEFNAAGGEFCFLPGSNRPEQPGEGRVAGALTRLEEWWGWTREHPPVAALDRILEKSGLIAYLAGGEMGSSRAGNCFKLLDTLREREGAEGLSFSGAVEFLEELIGFRDVEETTLFPGRSDAVRLMNLHKAKGLEAPIVFLAHPIGKRAHEPERNIRRVGSEIPDTRPTAAAEGAFAFSVSEGFRRRILSHPVGWEERAEDEKLYIRAEEIRLAYVAATRARNVLIISVYPGGDGERKSWRALETGLSDRPELPAPRTAGKPGARRLSPDPEGLIEALRERDSALNAAEAVGFRHETVTALAKSEAESPFRDSTGRGMAWGRMVHGILENLGRRPDSDPRLLVMNALASEDWNPDEDDRLLELIHRIQASDIWKRAMRAESRFVEMPFSLIRENGRTGERPEGGRERPPCPIILQGVIDLIFREPDGWVIVDFKTDAMIDRPERYVKAYAPQIRLYRKYWEELTGEMVKEAGLLFTDFTEPRWVRLP